MRSGCIGRPKHHEPEREKTWTHRADNRERLIDAGYTVPSEKGYEATTVKEVAHAAGVSPGLVHYYFASKVELLRAVLQEAGVRCGRLVRDLRASVPAERFLVYFEMPSNPEDRLGAALVGMGHRQAVGQAQRCGLAHEHLEGSSEQDLAVGVPVGTREDPPVEGS